MYDMSMLYTHIYTYILDIYIHIAFILALSLSYHDILKRARPETKSNAKKLLRERVELPTKQLYIHIYLYVCVYFFTAGALLLKKWREELRYDYR